MTLPVPCRFADALESLAEWAASPPCPSLTPRPDLVDYLASVARHVRCTMRPDDPRLASLEGVTDPDGYPHLSLEPECGELELFTRAAAGNWTAEQAVTALCDTAVRETWEVCGVDAMASGLYESGTRDHTCDCAEEYAS